MAHHVSRYCTWSTFKVISRFQPPGFNVDINLPVLHAGIRAAGAPTDMRPLCWHNRLVNYTIQVRGPICEQQVSQQPLLDYHIFVHLLFKSWNILIPFLAVCFSDHHMVLQIPLIVENQVYALLPSHRDCQTSLLKLQTGNCFHQPHRLQSLLKQVRYISVA